ALGCVLYVALLGLVMSIRLHAPDWLGGVSWLSWGRLRYAHTQGLFFGWLGNAFLAFLYFAVPRLAGRPVTGVRLGLALFAVWNGLLVLPGWALVQSGVSQPLEWAEFPLPVDGAATLGMLMAVAQFVVPLLRARVSSLYVSAWYVLGGLTFTLLLPGRQRGARVPPRRPGSDLQRTLDSRRGGFVRHPAGPGHRLRRHPRRLPAADLQPLFVDDRFLAAIPALPAQRHPPLRLLVDPDGGPEGGGRRLGLPGGGCRPGGDEPAAVA